jgi:hypothetical protein
MPMVKSGGVNKWSEDNNTLLTDKVLWAAALLSPSIVRFGDKTQREYGPAKLLKVEWIREDATELKIDLSHLAPGLNDDIVSRFEGVVFLITGPDLRLRTRALANHYGESFPEDNYPKGPFSLWSKEGARCSTYKWLMDQVKQLERDNKK